MRKSGVVRSFLASISNPPSSSVPAARRAVTPSPTTTATTTTSQSSSSSAATALSAHLLSGLGHEGSSSRDKPPPSSSPSPSPSSPSFPPLPPPSLGNSAAEVSREISVLLHSRENDEESTSKSSAELADQTLVNNLLGIEWKPNPSTAQNARKKEMTRERKSRYIFRNTDSRRHTKLMTICAKRLGSNHTVVFFSKLGRETSTKEYNALIALCTREARMNQDREEADDYIREAYHLLEELTKQGFVIEEASYGPILSYLVDFKMVPEFDDLSRFLKEENPRTLCRLGYYEMLLCIKVLDEERIIKLCESVGMASDDDAYSLAENYLLAFCETDRDKELSMLLNVLDINKVSKPSYVCSIFKSLGRLHLEHFADKFLSDISKAGVESERFSALVYEYVTNIPNLQAKEMVLKFVSLHEKFEATPHHLYYDKLISYFCNLNMIAEALVIVDYMCNSGLDVSTGAFNPILLACDKNCELHMVQSIYSLMREHNLGMQGETFKTLISLFVKMKNFQGAYKILDEAREVGETPTAGMYNAIIHGYFREKNRGGVQAVLNTMKNLGVEPDADTFSYMIYNSDTQEDISKYVEELRRAGLQITKNVSIGLIHAYTKLGNFDMAKQVVKDPDVLSKYYIADIKSTLMSGLASHGEISDAIKIYDEIKQDGFRPEPKAVVCLIENLKTEGEMERITGFLKELKDSVHWYDGCCRAILYCVQHNHIKEAIGLLKELREKDETSASMGIDQVFCHLRNLEPVKLETGMQLLDALKEELSFNVSRTSLDFLLSMCVKARDSTTAMVVWNEYKAAGLPYNVLTKLRMYQVFMASGRFKRAKKMLKEIPDKDEHVRYVIESCKQVYRH